MSERGELDRAAAAAAGERREWRHVDKSRWPGGPWYAEPDVIAWTDEETGLPCVIARHRWGHLCGYVGVRPGHPLHGQPAGPAAMIGHNGPVNYAAGQLPDLPGDAAAEVPAHLGAAWWFGFDTMHESDFMPNPPAPEFLELGGAYRTVAYMTIVCRFMARQATGLEPYEALAPLGYALHAEIERPLYLVYCPRCGKGSTYPADAVHGYCGECHDVTGVRGRTVPGCPQA